MHDPELLAGFRPRPTDVLLPCAPKAGTTWMQMITHQLRTGGDDRFESIHDVVPWLERPIPGTSAEERLAHYERLPDPRVFKTHTTYAQTPAPDVVRCVMTLRDPRDCCVSFYHHMCDMEDWTLEATGLRAPESFEAYFEHWLSFGAWFRSVESWWPHRDDDNVLILRYADLKSDLPAALSRIAAFLGWERTPAQLARAAELSSFAWMKANAERFTQDAATGRRVFRPGGFIRKGVVGDHDTLMTDAQARRVLEEAQRRLPEPCLAALGLS